MARSSGEPKSCEQIPIEAKQSRRGARKLSAGSVTSIQSARVPRASVQAHVGGSSHWSATAFPRQSGGWREASEDWRRAGLDRGWRRSGDPGDRDGAFCSVRRIDLGGMVAARLLSDFGNHRGAIAAVLVAIGIKRLDARQLAPQETIGQLEKDKETVKGM